MSSNCFKEEQVRFKAVSYTIEGRLLVIVNVLFLTVGKFLSDFTEIDSKACMLYFGINLFICLNILAALPFGQFTLSFTI